MQLLGLAMISERSTKRPGCAWVPSVAVPRGARKPGVINGAAGSASDASSAPRAARPRRARMARASDDGRPVSRRSFHRLAGLASLAVLAPRPGTAAAAAVRADADDDDLVARLQRAAPGLPAPRVRQKDLWYPAYFAGVWDTESTLLSVSCPAGYKLFGPDGSFEAAEAQIDTALRYRTRFLRADNGRVISDRVYNVRTIAAAAMGDAAVLECAAGGADGDAARSVRMSVRPAAADGRVFTVELRATARSQQEGAAPDVLGAGLRRDGDDVFRASAVAADEVTGEGVRAVYMSETVRQSVQLATDDLRVLPRVKVVETTSVFVPDGRDRIQGWQRTCSYVGRADASFEDARGRPVDVRWYALRYARRGGGTA